MPIENKIIKFSFPITPKRIKMMMTIRRLNYSSNYQFSDFLFNGNKIRIFNFHTPLWINTTERLFILQEGLNGMISDGNNIVAGDFNSFGHFPWNFLFGIITGAKWKDYKINELNEMKRICKQNELKYDSEIKVTYPLCKTHIDHIFCPIQWNSVACAIYNTLGSDHKLLTLEVH